MAMALSPEIDIDEAFDDEPEIETLKTYRIDYENMRITNELIEGIEAIKQFVYMALLTPRYSHSIYSDDYGSEIEELLADNDVTTEFKMTELPRVVEESLIYDERIDGVTDFNIEHIGGAFHVSFTVHSVEGILEIEEVLA